MRRVDPRAVARFIGIARVAIGAGLLAAPRLSAPVWVGRKGLTPAAKLFTRALAARDIAIGAGTLAGGELRPWVLAGMAADATDLLATILERDDLPPTAIPLVVATAGLGVAAGAYALSGADS